MMRRFILLCLAVALWAAVQAAAATGPLIVPAGKCLTTTLVCQQTTYVGMGAGFIRVKTTLTNQTAQRQGPLMVILADSKYIRTDKWVNGKDYPSEKGIMPLSVSMPFEKFRCCAVLVSYGQRSLAPHQTFTLYTTWPYRHDPLYGIDLKSVSRSYLGASTYVGKNKKFMINGVGMFIDTGQP